MLSTGQADLGVLASTATELERRERHYVAAFFQLPYVVLVEPGWHRLEAHTLNEGMFAEFSFSPFELVYRDDGDMALRAVGPDARPNWPVVTQVAALFPLWGIRARFHGKYLHHVEQGTKGNPIIIPQGPSWIDNRPISLGIYETNLAQRLIREIQAVLRSFLPAYSISALTEAPVPEWLYGYHSMPAPGRIMPAGQSVPVAKALVRSAVQVMPRVQPFAPIAQAMNTKFRVFGRFEWQLFAMERLRVEGEIALALIGGISLLEWVMKAIATASSKTKFEALLTSRPTRASPSSAARILSDLARRARNALVHEEPPLRRSLTTAGTTRRAQQAEAAGHCSSEHVRALLELAFKAFREADRKGIAVAALHT